MSGVQAAVRAFREAYLHGDDPRVAATLAGDHAYDSWGRLEARRLRCEINWAFWQNDAYRQIHLWSKRYKADFGLYRHTRPVYNPARRTVEFFVCHVFNGSIDPGAGDGSERPSAIPIVLDDEVGSRDGLALRAGLSRLWRDSRLQTEKSIWIRRGAVIGDAPIAAVDEPESTGRPGRIRLESWHPAALKWVDADRDGTVRSYIREERRYDPLGLGKLRNTLESVDPMATVGTVVYTETAEMLPDGSGVQYRTYRDREPFDWTMQGGTGEWTAPYPCVPLVLCQHIPIGGMWGMGEFHADLPKIREIDDVASKLNDQIRILVESPWLFSGLAESEVVAAKAKRTVAGRTDPAAQAEADRQKVAALYAKDSSAKAQALVAQMPIDHVTAQIASMLEEIERDHPELRYDRLTVSGELSGTALRKARQGAETKCNERRAEYDHALARIQEIALAMGGIRGYEGYPKGVSAADLMNGRFRHAVGDRTVFGVDALERLEEEQAEATATQTWTSAGVPLRTALVKVGWSEEDADEAEKAADGEAAKKQAAAAELAKARAPAAGGTNPADGKSTDVGGDATQPGG